LFISEVFQTFFASTVLIMTNGIISVVGNPTATIPSCGGHMLHRKSIVMDINQLANRIFPPSKERDKNSRSILTFEPLPYRNHAWNSDLPLTEHSNIV